MPTSTWDMGKLICTPLGHSSGYRNPLTYLGLDGWPHSDVVQSTLALSKSLPSSVWPLLGVGSLMAFICGTKTSQKQEESPNQCTRGFQASVYVTFANVLVAKASYLAKSWRGREPLKQADPRRHDSLRTITLMIYHSCLSEFIQTHPMVGTIVCLFSHPVWVTHEIYSNAFQTQCLEEIPRGRSPQGSSQVYL